MADKIGKPVKTLEGLRHITGQGRFVADIKLPNTLFCRFIRSTYPHAILKSVEGPASARIFTWRDLEKIATPFKIEIPLRGVKPHHLHYLACDKVRYVGEPVAMLLSEDPYILADLAEEVVVDYEPLKPVSDVESALADGAPLLYEDWGSNVAASLDYRVGDPESMLSSSPLVLEKSFHIGRVTPAPLEPRAILAYFDRGTGILTVYISNQAPHVERALLSQAIGIPENRVRVITPDVGGAFGQKCLLYPEDVAVCIASILTGRPVKYVESRGENLTASSHAREQHHQVKIGVKRDGEIQAIIDRIKTDIGAGILYPHSSIGTSIVAASMLPGPYRFQHYRAEILCVATNKCPFGAYRGLANPKQLSLWRD
ncbi:Caffeine dehydrogenase subunit alpha [archaeon HR01]|nr:Caffeine dehydrogenase subunit alpha [archaeon HR01]